MGVYQVARVISSLVDFYQWLVVIWCIMSWFPRRDGSLLDDVATVINSLVEPYVGIFRRFVPPIGGMDFSPMIALFVLVAAERALIQLLFALA